MTPPKESGVETALPIDQSVDPGEMARLFAEAKATEHQAGVDRFEADVAAMQDRLDAGLPRHTEDDEKQLGINRFENSVAELNEQQRQRAEVVPVSTVSEEEGRQNFDKAVADLEVSDVGNARNLVGRAFDSISERREERVKNKAYDEAWKEGHAENAARDEAERVQAEAKEEARLAREKEAAAERGRLLGEERKEAYEQALVGPDSFEDFAKHEIDKLIDPLVAELRNYRRHQLRLLQNAERMPLVARKELESKLNHELDSRMKHIAQERKRIIEQLAKQRETLTDALVEQVGNIYEFTRDLREDNYVYEPDPDMHPELAALVAGSNAALVDAEREPLKVDDYEIKHLKGPATRMQRMIYRTANPSLFVVEEWDRTSGKLKRQALMKGSDLLVPEVKGRFNRKTGEMTISDEAYSKIGVIKSDQVIDDAETAHKEGYKSYVRNLTRAGGLGLSSAKELASPERPLKAGKGFLQLLEEEWNKNKASKPKKSRRGKKAKKK